MLHHFTLENVRSDLLCAIPRKKTVFARKRKSLLHFTSHKNAMFKYVNESQLN